MTNVREEDSVVLLVIGHWSLGFGSWSFQGRVQLVFDENLDGHLLLADRDRDRLVGRGGAGVFISPNTRCGVRLFVERQRLSQASAGARGVENGPLGRVGATL